MTVSIQAQSLLPVHNGVVYICTLAGCGSLTSYWCITEESTWFWAYITVCAFVTLHVRACLQVYSLTVVPCSLGSAAASFSFSSDLAASSSQLLSLAYAFASSLISGSSSLTVIVLSKIKKTNACARDLFRMHRGQRNLWPTSQRCLQMRSSSCTKAMLAAKVHCTYVFPLGFTLEKAISKLFELQFLPNMFASVHHFVISLLVASRFSALVAHLPNEPFTPPPLAIFGALKKALLVCSLRLWQTRVESCMAAVLPLPIERFRRIKTLMHVPKIDEKGVLWINYRTIMQTAHRKVESEQKSRMKRVRLCIRSASANDFHRKWKPEPKMSEFWRFLPVCMACNTSCRTRAASLQKASSKTCNPKNRTRLDVFHGVAHWSEESHFTPWMKRGFFFAQLFSFSQKSGERKAWDAYVMQWDTHQIHYTPSNVIRGLFLRKFSARMLCLRVRSKLYCFLIFLLQQIETVHLCSVLHARLCSGNFASFSLSALVFSWHFQLTFFVSRFQVFSLKKMHPEHPVLSWSMGVILTELPCFLLFAGTPQTNMESCQFLFHGFIRSAHSCSLFAASQFSLCKKCETKWSAPLYSLKGTVLKARRFNSFTLFLAMDAVFWHSYLQDMHVKRADCERVVLNIGEAPWQSTNITSTQASFRNTGCHTKEPKCQCLAENFSRALQMYNFALGAEPCWAAGPRPLTTTLFLLISVSPCKFFKAEIAMGRTRGQLHT